MTGMQVAQRMTADEFLAGPETPGKRWELVDGELVMHEPSPLHQAALQAIYDALRDWTRAEAGRGVLWFPLDVKLDDANVLGPDLLWYRAGRGPARTSKPPSPMPDLVVEVRSPSTWRHDIGAKKTAYEAHGLPELWLVDTEAQLVLSYGRSQPARGHFDLSVQYESGDVLGSPQLPGFSIEVDTIFAEVT